MIRVGKALKRYVLAAVFQLFPRLFLSIVKIHKDNNSKYTVYPTSIRSLLLLKEDQEVKNEENEHGRSTLLFDLSNHYFNLNNFHQSHNFSFCYHLQEGQPLLFTRYRTFLIWFSPWKAVVKYFTTTDADKFKYSFQF